MATEKTTLSVIKADIGGFVGHGAIHPDLVTVAQGECDRAKRSGLLVDFHVTNVGDDLQLIMTHRKGVDATPVHEFAYKTFLACTAKAKELKLYGAGQDLLSDAFSGNVKGMGPGVAEFEIAERPSEPVVVFCADKTSPGAWSLPLYRMFADPFNTPGLVIDPKMRTGFDFEVLDGHEGKAVTLHCPEETYELLALIGSINRFFIRRIYRRSDGEIAAVASTQRLAEVAGKYVGKDDPVCVVRGQAGFPAIGEVLEPFAFPHLVEGWMRGSHHGPIMPVSHRDATPTRFDGPPRVIGVGFQLADGRLVGPRDMFDDPAYDRARQTCNEIADYLRRHGPFEPHRLSEEAMEYTTLPEVFKKLEKRFVEDKEPAVGVGAGATSPSR